MGEWEKKYYVDYRFIVEVAEDIGDACDKADAMIKEATDEVWYTISKATTMQKNPDKKHFPWGISSVRWEDPREKVQSSTPKVKT